MSESDCNYDFHELRSFEISAYTSSSRAMSRMAIKSIVKSVIGFCRKNNNIVFKRETEQAGTE
jgi:hypothetical protein